MAINDCIAEGILEEFLRKERSRVKSVLLYGMTEEEIRETQQNILNKAVADSREEGVREGVAIGRDQILAMITYLTSQDRYEDLARASSDKEFCQTILDEMLDDGRMPMSTGKTDDRRGRGGSRDYFGNDK